MGSKAPSTQTQVNKTEMSPEQQKLFDLAMPYAEQYAKQPLESYKGPTLAGLSPEEIQAQEAYKNATGTTNPLAQQAAASQKFMLSTDQLNPDTNPYINKAASNITDTIRRDLVEKAMPAIRGTSIANGGMFAGGSTRADMANRFAGMDAVDRTGRALNDLYMTNYSQGINNIARAQQLNPSVMSQQLFGADVLGAIGGQNRGMEQAFMDDAARRWSLEQSLPFMRASELTGLINSMPGATGVTTNTGIRPTTNPMMSTLGGAASGAALGTAIMPGVGTGIGAAVGGLGGYLTSR